MSNDTPMNVGRETPGNISDACKPRSRAAARKPRILRRSKTTGSRSLGGGILVYPRKQTRGKWMVMWRTREGRRYRSFPSLGAANGFASDLQRGQNESVAAPVHDMPTAAEARLLRELRQATQGVALSEILRAWDEYQARHGSLPIGEVVRRFVEARMQEGVARYLRTNHAVYLRRFADSCGAERPVNTIMPDDARAWVSGLLAGGYSPKTVRHHLRALSMLFKRAIAEGWASRNPCLAVVTPKVVPGEVSVLSLADARALFAANRGRRVALYMALEAFGGLRFSSAIRIAPEDIRVEDRLIVLPAAKHKTRRRHVLEDLPENLWEWIRQAEQIDEPGWRKRPWRMSAPVYNREKRAAFERAGVRSAVNVLRHAFCSYHVAHHQDAAKTAVLMQHSNQVMLYRHYKGVATRADAAAYFAITPSSAQPSADVGASKGDGG